MLLSSIFTLLVEDFNIFSHFLPRITTMVYYHRLGDYYRPSTGHTLRIAALFSDAVMFMVERTVRTTVQSVDRDLLLPYYK